MTMWGGRFSEGPSALLRALNDSFAFDRELLAEDVEGSIAWAQELGHAGVLTSAEAKVLVDTLLECGGTATALKAAAKLPHSIEDVHSYVEGYLRETLGGLAGKLHTGRSRNDQVATDLKLWLKKACDDASALASSLIKALAQKAFDEAATPMPGYTHLKQAEPVTFGHWCLAYAEMLTRDASRIATDAESAPRDAAYGLPVTQSFTYSDTGTEVTFRTTITRIGAEAPPAELLIIPPAATRVESTAATVRRQLHELDLPATSKPQQ